MTLVTELAAIAQQVREGCEALRHACAAEGDFENASIAELNEAYAHTLEVLNSLNTLDENTRGTLNLFRDEMNGEFASVTGPIKQTQSSIKQEVLGHYQHRAQELPDMGTDKRALIPLGGFQIRNNIKVVVQDRNLVPDKYKSVDMPALKKALQKGIVPGTSYKIESSVAYRADQD